MSARNDHSAVAPADRVLVITRLLAAPPAQVFQAWTDPARMMKWFAPEGMATPLAECELRVGGRYRVLMRESDGVEHDVSGEYLEIVPDRKLVFTWAWRNSPEIVTLVTVELEPEGRGTQLTLRHERLADAESRDSHNSGWSSALTKLEKLVTGAS
jgi:uncharacterized protein YndB with AHSA1/START domain